MYTVVPFPKFSIRYARRDGKIEGKQLAENGMGKIHIQHKPPVRTPTPLPLGPTSAPASSDCWPCPPFLEACPHQPRPLLLRILLRLEGDRHSLPHRSIHSCQRIDPYSSASLRTPSAAASFAIALPFRRGRVLLRVSPARTSACGPHTF